MKNVDADWIRERVGDQRGLLVKLADFVGITPQKMSKIMSGERRVQAAEVPKFMQFFGEITVSAAQKEAQDLLVPVFDLAASAGFGALVDGPEEESHSLAFPPNYLKAITSTKPANLAIISVKGDSMEPTLHDDDIVMLDRTKTDLNWDGLFVLRYESALHVKRVSRAQTKGVVRIVSDNVLYAPLELPMKDIYAVGKVLWYGRKV